MKITNNKERGKRSDKIVELAAGATAAVLLFNKTGLRKFASEATRAISRASDDIGKDIASKSIRELDYKTIKNIYNKRIKSSTSKFQKSFNQNGVIESSMKDGLSQKIRELRNFKLNKNAIANKMKDAEMKTQLMNRLKKELVPGKDAEKKMFQVVNNIIDDKGKFIIKRTNDDGTVDRVLSKGFDNMIEGTVLEKHMDEMKDILIDEYDKVNKSGLLEEINEKFNRTIKENIEGQMEENIIEAGKKEGTKFFDDTVERAATIADIIKDREGKNGGAKFDKEVENVIEEVLEFRKKYSDSAEDIDKMVFSNDLRVYKGKIYSGKSFDDSINLIKEDLADTIPGKLFGARSFIDKKKAPNFYMFAKSSYDPNIANLTGSTDNILDDNFFYIMGKTYKAGNGGELIHQKSLDGIELVSGVHGVLNVLNDRMHGNFNYRKNGNKFLDYFSINTTGTNIFDTINGIKNKFSSDNEWKKTRLTNLINGEIITNDPSTIYDNYEAVKELNALFKNTMRAPTKKESVNVVDIFTNKKAKSIITALNEENPIQYLLDNDLASSVSGNLKSIMNMSAKDKGYLDTLVKIGNLGGIDGLNVLHGNDIVKREILKSAMAVESLKGGADNIKGYARLSERINGAGVSDSSKQYLQRMLNWTNIETRARLDVSNSFAETESSFLATISTKMSKFFSENTLSNAQEHEYKQLMKEDLRKLISENTSLFDSTIEKDPSSISKFKNEKWIGMQKAKGINALGIIESINKYLLDEGMKFRDTEAGKFLKQFVAGRNDAENITSATLLPYHMLNRLITPMEKFGIGLDPRFTSSTADLAKNIMTKRIMPIAGGLTALSYLNYETENLTGTSIEESYENAKANAVLGIKQMQSTIGIDDSMKRNRMNNPILNYLFGEYKNDEEYLDYLEYGSDPVRKGRYWSFGSTSEFRGGKIAYWEPNSLRQAHSNYRDIAIYGSSEEKWSRSLIPSLRHPLSPLKFMMNPYWVEDLNYDDRPYPVSGKLFAEGTPWGALLNPTIGQIIKPQIRMHREDMHGLNDSRSIINEINLAIKNNSKEASVARLDGAGVTPMALSPKGMPSMDGAIMSFGISDNNINLRGVRGADFADNLPGMEYSAMPSTDLSGSSEYAVINNDLDTNENLVNAMLNTMNEASYNFGNRIDPNLIIAQLNRETKHAGNTDDVVTTERARLAATPHKEATKNMKERYLKSINLNSVDGGIMGITDSAKELGGMYGFLYEQIMPNKKGYRLAEAGDMTSFSRGFWDSNIGGMGGDFMEIARRFFPHENHNIQSVNPLRNTQPLWMPERFWVGDPYTSLPKGEARLPGRGYEALNKLHSDKYGRYGSFDRFKILADIAPGSEEYKIWKKIAKEEISDPSLKGQMQVIEEQAAEQIKEHDFYNYRFLTKNMEDKKAVIETVNSDGTFTVVGEEQTYALAGLDIDGRDSKVQEYLNGGMEVTLKYEGNKYNKYRNKKTWEKNKPPVIAAIVDRGGENIGAKMFNDGAAKEMSDDDKTTLADNIFTASSQDITMGHLWEAIGHARIPYFHNKFLRINSPMESYKHEQVYGTSYATWNHPIKGFVMPAFREAWSKGPIAQAVGVGTWALSEWARTTDMDNGVKKAAHGLFAMTNPGAFAGGLMGALPRMSVGSGNGILNAKMGARAGAIIGLGGYAISNLENPLLSALNFGVLGAAAMNQLKPEVGKGIVKEVLDTKFGAMAGVVIGIGLSSLKNPDFKLSNLNEKYIPDETKKKWDLEEYFDRLNYLKYDALYRKAAREAKDKENIDIEKIMNIYEYRRESNKERMEELEEQKLKRSKYISDPGKREEYIRKIDLKIEQLETPEQYFAVGEYTRSALAYKKARDTTIFGLTSFSNNTDILRALPKYDRDFFLEFAKEKDPKERKEILSYVSPFKAKALKAMWGEELEEQESNAEFFGNHNLPGLFWSGWNPNVDMEHVKMKTIENEGMLLSDFGLYESAKLEPSAMSAPEIEGYRGAESALAVQASIQGMLGGLGLVGVDVSVSSGASNGIEVIANVASIGAQKISNISNSIVNLFV